MQNSAMKGGKLAEQARTGFPYAHFPSGSSMNQNPPQRSQANALSQWSQQLQQEEALSIVANQFLCSTAGRLPQQGKRSFGGVYPDHRHITKNIQSHLNFPSQGFPEQIENLSCLGSSSLVQLSNLPIQQDGSQQMDFYSLVQQNQYQDYIASNSSLTKYSLYDPMYEARDQHVDPHLRIFLGSNENAVVDH